jgi:hypothetical protein
VRIFYSTFKFAIDRIPNACEVLPEVLFRSFISLISVDSLKSFYKDLIASSILKDISKLPFSFYNIFNEQEVGGTGYVYDAGEIYVMSAKILCKSALLVPTQIFLPNKVLKMGYISNYVCEPANRFFIVTSKNKQDSKNHQISYIQYIYNNAEYSWIGDAILFSIAKVKIKTSVASYMQEFNINPNCS